MNDPHDVSQSETQGDAAHVPLPTLEPAPLQPGRGVSPRTGLLHSYENASTVDGPGFRYVVWLMGCHLRCQYCHNPDTWPVNRGQPHTVEQIVADVAKYAQFLKATKGGFTVSGGEPLVQAPFAIELLRAMKTELGLHVAMDTNGYLGHRLSDEDLEDVDLFLLDLKAFDAEHHRVVTGHDNTDILNFARRLAERQRPAWVRYVLVPGLTDGAEDIEALAEFVAPMSNVERVEVLPFHQMGRDKWKKLDLDYPLADTPAATPDQAKAAIEIFRAAGCPVV
ncbi:pyruvate formate-lyase-activating protein [Algisphaera agarilytica]|uniref:Pyruvate formate-lyase-activating enzyme n=1 Tax=Algisphaera agarilytica TaxID=1385975 RepID=A0A7X0H2Q4_9BACT|nr:pyruvate formate-lyase-activating protein [Algisphaera agarilytica]MBB6428202.1 pyruvate formate lyase activating enzyme [Algisphaera agarilytica]